MIARMPIRILACAPGAGGVELGRLAGRDVQPGAAAESGRPQGATGPEGRRRRARSRSRGRRAMRRSGRRRSTSSGGARGCGLPGRLPQGEEVPASRGGFPPSGGTGVPGQRRSAAEEGRDLDIQPDAGRALGGRSRGRSRDEGRRAQGYGNTSGSSDASHGPDRSGRCPGPVGLDDLSSAERLAILERETDRLRYEMDRTDKGLRTHLRRPLSGRRSVESFGWARASREGHAAHGAPAWRVLLIACRSAPRPGPRRGRSTAGPR